MIGELGTKSLRNLFGGNIPTAQVLQGIASGMASCGVSVVIDPKCTVPYAVVRDKKIVLPTQVRSERALLVVNWFVDHEAAHLIFTPDLRRYIRIWETKCEMLKVLKKHGFNNFPDSLLMAAKSMLNLAEDARIEKLMIERIPGTKKHFLGGPIACDLADIPGDMIAEAKKAQAEMGLPEYPINPFWAGQMHVYHYLDGTHMRHPKDHVRKVLKGHSVEPVLDIVDDEFGDIKDVTKHTMDDLFYRTDRAMARIFDLVLDQAEEDEDEGEGDGEGGEGESESADNPFQTKFKKSKKGKGKGKKFQESDDDSEPDDSEPSEGGGEGESEEENDQDGSAGSGEGSSEEEDESENSSSSSGEDEEEEGDNGEGSEDEGDSEEGNPEEDSDEDSESEGDESEEDSDSGENSDDETDSEEQESEEQEGENDAEANQEQKVPKQVEEWAQDAQADMADLMRGSEEQQDGGEGGASSNTRGSSSGNPVCDPNADTSGMPDEYFKNIAPGSRTIYVTGADLSRLVNQNNMKSYVDIIRGLIPPNLGPAARKLVGQFKEARGEAWTGKRINPRRLGQIKAGTAYDKKLFLRNNQTTLSRKGVAVMVLVDCSGSMTSNIYGANFKARLADSKFAMSHASALGIARLLQAINVPFAVGGFTTEGAFYGGYSRDCNLVHLLFKDFHEPWNSSEINLLSFNTFSTYTLPDGTYLYTNCNSDGEAVIWGATHLLTRDEDTKVLIVISDGLPAGGNRTKQSGFLKWAIRRCMLAGIRVGGFGLGCKEVSAYYPIHEILDRFNTGEGEENVAPFILQEKIISLIEKVMTYDPLEVR